MLSFRLTVLLCLKGRWLPFSQGQLSEARTSAGDHHRAWRTLETRLSHQKWSHDSLGLRKSP